jgi:nitrate reductase molybdenum cofactor assembly chaperone NarJ/NarW
MNRRSRRTDSLTPEQLTLAWHSASLLLGYPEERLLRSLETIHRVSHRLPDAVGGPLRSTVVHLETAPVGDLQAEYVDTFDTRLRRRLFLSHLAHGDTPRRGLALHRLRQTYLRSGFDLDYDSVHAGEPPDHLCVVLEYAANIDQTVGRHLLRDHRGCLESLRAALQVTHSGWTGALAAVCATLPPPGVPQTTPAQRTPATEAAGWRMASPAGAER